MKCDDIVSVLTELYGSRLTPDEILHFARQLRYCLTAEDCALTEILVTAYEFEAEANIADRDSRAWSVFTEMSSMLEPCAATADRLYDCFMHDLDDFNIFFPLVTVNADHLSKERLQAAKAKGAKLFDRELLRSCGLYDD